MYLWEVKQTVLEYGRKLYQQSWYLLTFQITTELVCRNFQENLGGEVYIKLQISSLQFYDHAIYRRCFLEIHHKFQLSESVLIKNKLFHRYLINFSCFQFEFFKSSHTQNLRGAVGA